ncbi:MAG: DUF1318 domain-containing protein [Verrucomicrobiota bacterium]
MARLEFMGHGILTAGNALLLIAAFFLCSCGKPDNRSLDSVASSIRARASVVQGLKEARKITENGRGYLRSEQGIYLDIQDRRIVEEENYERGKAFALIAKENAVGKKNVETIFAAKASRPR